MPKLKNINAFTPRGPQLLLPEVGMKNAMVGSINELRGEFDKIVRRNPSLAQKYNWPTDPKGQMDFVEQREVARLIAQGWVEFIDFSAPGDTWINPTGVKKNWSGAAAVVVNRGKAAFAAYKNMYGPKGPVGRDVADGRAEICVLCKKNDVKGGLASYFLESTAKGIMSLLGALKDLEVRTTKDDELGVCLACKCPLRAKIWTPIDVVAEHTDDEIWSQLPRENPKCWILTESNHA